MFYVTTCYPGHSLVSLPERFIRGTSAPFFMWWTSKPGPSEYVNVNIGFPSSGAFPGNSSTKPVKRESERNVEKVAQQQHIHKQDGNIMAP